MKKILGILLSLVLCMSLMVGCSSDENDNSDQNNQFEEPQNDINRAYGLIKYAIEHTTDENNGVGPFNNYADINVVENDNDVTIEIQVTDKLDEIAADFSDEDWTKSMIEPSLQISDMIYEELGKENIDIELKIDILTSDRSLIITQITRGQITQNNFNQYKNSITKNTYTNNSQAEQPKQPKQEINKKFYIGNDGLYHCSKCNNVPSKEEYNNGVCYSCEQHKEAVQQCYHCYAYIEPGHEYVINGLVYCEQCAIDMQSVELDETWICPDCGRVNKGEVLCECELEEGNY